MLRHLASAEKAVGLVYRLLTSAVLIGALGVGVYKAIKRR